MSDPLKGLKPTTGYAELGNENDAGGEVEVGGICVSTDRRARFAGEYVISRDEMNANLLLIADAFNTYTATGLAPSQLQQSFADEKNAHGLAKDKALGWKVEAEILRKDLADEKALTAELVAAANDVCGSRCAHSDDERDAGVCQMPTSLARCLAKAGNR